MEHKLPAQVQWLSHTAMGHGQALWSRGLHLGVSEQQLGLQPLRLQNLSVILSTVCQEGEKVQQLSAH